MKDFTLNLSRSKGRRTLDKVEGFTTSIGQKTKLNGTIIGTGHYIVYGEVDGDCDIDGAVVIGESGVWRGNIKAHTVVVAGKVIGDITASDKMEIVSTAQIQGCIKSKVIAIAEGAVHDGKLQMSDAEQLTRFTDKRDSV